MVVVARSNDLGTVSCSAPSSRIYSQSLPIGGHHAVQKYALGCVPTSAGTRFEQLPGNCTCFDDIAKGEGASNTTWKNYFGESVHVA